MHPSHKLQTRKVSFGDDGWASKITKVTQEPCLNIPKLASCQNKQESRCPKAGSSQPQYHAPGLGANKSSRWKAGTQVGRQGTFKISKGNGNGSSLPELPVTKANQMDSFFQACVKAAPNRASSLRRAKTAPTQRSEQTAKK